MTIKEDLINQVTSKAASSINGIAIDYDPSGRQADPEYIAIVYPDGSVKGFDIEDPSTIVTDITQFPLHVLALLLEKGSSEYLDELEEEIDELVY